jgi:hypothetical protein
MCERVHPPTPVLIEGSRQMINLATSAELRYLCSSPYCLCLNEPYSRGRFHLRMHRNVLPSSMLFGLRDIEP